MAITVDELAIIVDSSVTVCIEDEGTGELSLVIEDAQIRVGAGPELKDVEGNGLTTAIARDDYADKVRGKVLVVGGNPRGLEVRVPDTIIGSEP
jgi:hypothetical protein